VLSLATAGAFLLTGGRGMVLGWDWAALATGQVEEPDWALEVPSGSDVNSMLVLAEGGTQGRLVLGAGDNKVYIFDLETRQMVSSFAGHSDYVHSVAAGQDGGDGGSLVSGSEDGTVRLWDARKAEEVHCLVPAEKDQLARPHLGKHVSCVAVASDWLVCGGGPRLGLWHLRTLSPSVTLPPGDVEARAVSIHDDTLLCGGRKVVYQTNLTGEVTAEVAVSSTVTYSLAWQHSGDHKLLCVAGSSSYIDICTNNFNYRDATISFPVSLL
jgi:THO complex subunit 6